jgi:DNA-binding NtrC family response regulator
METINPMKIFLVDDDMFCLNMYKQHLDNLNYKNVTCFDSGEICLENLADLPDVIFLDHDMDSITGLEVLKKIKQFNPAIFVVLLSGKASLKTAVNALKFGAFDYIVKGLYEFENISKVLNNINKLKHPVAQAK